jgi:hypothetical protein
VIRKKTRIDFLSFISSVNITVFSLLLFVVEINCHLIAIKDILIMSQISIILSCILISIFLTNLCSASLLLVDRKNPCRAYGNASVYDITNLVKTWPVTLKGSGFYGEEYIYWWSCAGTTRQCEDTDTAICQQRTDGPTIRFNAGNVSPQLWFGVFNGAAFRVIKFFLLLS